MDNNPEMLLLSFPMRARPLIIFLTIFYFGTISFASEQSPERLLLEGVETATVSLPLEVWFEKNQPRPQWLTETNTACWRGYIGTWEVKSGVLFLNELTRDEWKDPEKDPVVVDITKRVFPGATVPIKASWFTGRLSVPQGKVLRTEGFTSIHEKNVVMTFIDGILTSRNVIDNRAKPRSFLKGKVP